MTLCFAVSIGQTRQYVGDKDIFMLNSLVDILGINRISREVLSQGVRAMAGLVTYPPDNIFYIYHTRLWTVLHQILAVALRAGVSEITLSLVISGVQGMLTFQALALFVYALSRDVLLGVGAAVSMLRKDEGPIAVGEEEEV